MRCPMHPHQAWARGMLARKEARALRQQKAATTIQTAWRRHKMRQQFQAVLHTITHLQVRRAATRALAARPRPCCCTCLHARMQAPRSDCTA